MTTAIDTDSPPTEATAALRTAPGLPRLYGRILQAAEETSGVRAYYRSALAVIAERCGALFGLVNANASSGAFVESYNDGTAGADFWYDTAITVLTDVLVDGTICSRGFRSGGHLIAALAVPLEDEYGGLQGCIVLLVPCPREEISERLSELVLLAGFALQCATSVGRDRQRGGGGGGDAQALQAMRASSRYESRQELAFGLANQLKTKSACEQVSLGEVRQGRVRVLVISGFDEVKKRAPGVLHIRQAMEECVDHDRVIVYQASRRSEDEDAPALDYRLHRQWHESCGGEAVATVPLRIDDEVRYVLALRRGRGRAFREDEVEGYREMIEPYAPVLNVVERANQGMVQHFCSGWRGLFQRLTHGGHWLQKGVALAVVSYAIYFGFGTRSFQLRERSTVVASGVHNISAPVDGVLAEVLVEPGNRVSAGDLLCRIDDTELRLHAEKLAADLDRERAEERRARAERDTVGLQLAGARRRKVEAQLSAVRLRIEQARIVAQVDGLVVAGDLRTREGDTVRRGEPLLQISESGHWELQVEVPDEDIEHFEAGLVGNFAPASRPGHPQRFIIERVDPGSTPREGRNIYIARARLDTDVPWIRAGMEGYAKVELGHRRVWWITLHRILDHLELGMWW